MGPEKCFPFHLSAPIFLPQSPAVERKAHSRTKKSPKRARRCSNQSRTNRLKGFEPEIWGQKNVLIFIFLPPSCCLNLLQWSEKRTAGPRSRPSGRGGVRIKEKEIGWNRYRAEIWGVKVFLIKKFLPPFCYLNLLQWTKKVRPG